MRLEYLYDKNPSGFLPVFKSVKEGYTGGIDPLVHLPKLRAWAAVTSHKSMHNMNLMFIFLDLTFSSSLNTIV